MCQYFFASQFLNHHLAAPACIPADSISLPAQGRYYYFAATHASTRGIGPNSQQLPVCKLHLTANFRGRVTELRRRGTCDACPTRLTARYLRNLDSLNYATRKVLPLPRTHLDSRSPPRPRRPAPTQFVREKLRVKDGLRISLVRTQEKK